MSLELEEPLITTSTKPQTVAKPHSPTFFVIQAWNKDEKWVEITIFRAKNLKEAQEHGNKYGKDDGGKTFAWGIRDNHGQWYQKHFRV